ncbi:hypothetical protein ACIB24_00355 [Spongisporangium articulatum]|uniref:Transglycosylase SLT domain-containing protein n=1 Tax=Spongisporangium articulatum TaxID=3362603 RepID=A0ABW8AGM2_9ACTN
MRRGGATATRLWRDITKFPVRAWTGNVPLPASMHPGVIRRVGRWTIHRQRYLLLTLFPLAVLSLSASQHLLPVVAAPAAPASTVENESFYYDGLWSGGSNLPPSGTVPTAQNPADTPYGVGSASTLTASGIPQAAYRAYVNAANELAKSDPTCGINWSVLGGIGRVESNHGRFGGSTIGIDGVVRPPILGIRLDGSRSARITDSDDGKYDGDTQFDRAVGPMQFIPGTWKAYGGGKNPQDMNAAALAAGKYLCAGGSNMLTQKGRWAAVYRYNHSDSYVSLVLSIADSYASGHVVTFPTRPNDTKTDDKGEEATPGGKPPAADPDPTPTTKPTTKPTSTPTASPTGIPSATSSPSAPTSPTTKPTTAPPSTSAPATPQPSSTPSTTCASASATPSATVAPQPSPTASCPAVE